MMAKYREIQNVLEITIDPFTQTFDSLNTFRSNNTGQRYTLGTRIR